MNLTNLSQIAKLNSNIYFHPVGNAVELADEIDIFGVHSPVL